MPQNDFEFDRETFTCLVDERNNKLIYPKIISQSSLDIKIDGKGNKFFIRGNMSLFGKIHVHFSGNNNTVDIGERCIVKRNLYLCFFPAGPQFKGDNCSITIGNGNNFNGDNICFECSETNTQISVGDNCLFAKNVKLTVSDGHPIVDVATGQRCNATEDIIIGSHIWFCEDALVLKGAEIADHSVVACRAVVTKNNYPQNCILGGVPAKVIKSCIDWSW